jgi:hypothetical protein
MGLFSKVKKGLQKVGSKIVNGIKKAGSWLKDTTLKVLSNKWVQRGLMAAAIFTGGVAIVNGVMQGYAAAGAATGAKAGLASQFSAKFVAGADAFIKGVGAGLASPISTAGDIASKASGALSGAGAAAGNAGAAANAAAKAGNVIAPTSNAANTMLSAAETAVPKIGQWGGAAGNTTLAQSVNSALGVGAKTANAANALPAASSGNLLQSLAKGAGKFASSPLGMHTIASGIAGYADGQAKTEIFKRGLKEEERARRTWDGFGDSGNFDIPPLGSMNSIRERRNQLYDRGDIAQRRFGY